MSKVSGATYRGTTTDSKAADEKGIDAKAVSCTLCGSQEVRDIYHLKNGLTVRKCRNCQLVFNAFNGEYDNPGKFYGEEYYQERSTYYFHNKVFDDVQGSDNRNLRDFQEGLTLLAPFKGSGKLLDVGCGIGVFLSLAREDLWEVKGVDVSPYAVRCAREKFGLDVRLGSLQKVGFPDQEFDCITMWDAFEHFPDPSDQLKEIHRLLKEDGLLLLNTPNGDAFLRVLAHFLYRTTIGKIAYPVEKLFHKYHLYYYTKQTLTRMLLKEGFEITWFDRRPIPLVKARGSKLEKLVVGAFSLAERALGREYELWVLARKKSSKRNNHGQ